MFLCCCRNVVINVTIVFMMENIQHINISIVFILHFVRTEVDGFPCINIEVSGEKTTKKTVTRISFFNTNRFSEEKWTNQLILSFSQFIYLWITAPLHTKIFIHILSIWTSICCTFQSKIDNDPKPFPLFFLFKWNLFRFVLLSQHFW